MVNTILVLSKQGHAGFRMPRFTPTSFSVSLQWRKANCFSLPILNEAACHHHGCCLSSCPSGLLLCPPYPSPWLPSTSSAAKRNLHGATGIGWFQHTDTDRKTSCRSFASKSKWNNHNTDQLHKAKQDKGQSKYSPGQLTVQYILDNYMQKRESLKPYQLALEVWNKLGRAIEKSRKWERHNFWVEHETSFQMLVDQTIQSADQFDGRHTATVTHSLVKILHYTNSKNLGARESLWNALLHKTILHIKSDGFNAYSLSNLIWAYAKADGIIKVDGRLLSAIADKAELCVDEFAPQGLANVAWGFATLNHKAPSLFDAIAGAGQVCIAGFKPQELSNISWAFATLNQEAPPLFDAISKAAQVQIGNFNPQNLSNMIMAYAKMNHQSPELFDVIAKACKECLDDFNPQALSNTTWAFATLKHEAPFLFDAIASMAQVCIDDFNPQSLSNLAWAFATLNHEAPLLFDGIASMAQVCIDDFKPQELSNLAWAFATLNQEAPSLFEAIARAAPVCLNEFNHQELANTAWSFAVFNIKANLFTHPDSPFAQALLSADPSIFTIEGLSQLHQFQLWCREQNGENWLSEELGQWCLDAFVSQEDTTSRLQNDVMESLCTLQDVNHLEVEVQTNIGYSLDAVIVFQGYQIGIEVDGPSHFVGLSQSPSGKTILKHRQLCALESWKLVSVPYWEWHEIDKGSNKERKAKKQQYLQSLLDETVLGP